MAIEFEGLEDVLLALDSKQTEADTVTAMGKACALVEKAARRKAPKGRTGDLRKFITSKVETTGGNVVGTVYSPQEYAPYVEYGTGLFAEGGGRTDVPWAYVDEATGELIWTCGSKPRPFLRPALNENRERITRLLGEGLTSD